MKPILDVCCGARMMWFDKRNPLATFVDKRQQPTFGNNAIGGYKRAKNHWLCFFKSEFLGDCKNPDR